MEKNLSEKTAKRINELRTKYGYTMESLAEKIGVSKSTIAKWENGYVQNMRQEKVMALAKIFNVAPTYILGYDDTDNVISEIKDGMNLYLESQNRDTRQPKLEERMERFIDLYQRLDPDEQTLIDNMLTTLASKK